MAKIVVGVDGSQPSSSALKWAIAEAKLRCADLDIVVSWDYPVMTTSEPIFIPTPDRSVFESGAERTAEQMIADSGLAESGVVYHVITPEGRPGETLVDRAAGADLLVVGSHGSGIIKELFLGSVSNYCAHHSPCPVVLVRTRPGNVGS
ncbi:MAG: universal stress protein [Ilumatobacteraceae bacterium]